MAKTKVVTKKPTIWEGHEFKGKVVFPETYKEAEEMGYPEEMVMSLFEQAQTVRAQSVIASFVQTPEDYEDGHVPTDDEVQAHLDGFDFTKVNRRSLTVKEKTKRATKGASIDELMEIQAEIDAKIAAAKAGEAGEEEEVEEVAEVEG